MRRPGARVTGPQMGRQIVPGDYTVLVVDSDVQASAQLASLLARAGYRTREFLSAEALLRETGAWPENVCVIAEVELPGMTGLELAARLRQDKVIAPFIILTRLSDVATAVRAMRDRVSDYLTKPYVERDLITRLRAALLGESPPLH